MQGNITSSPQLRLAGLFLEKVNSISSQLSLAGQGEDINNTFSQILEKNFNRGLENSGSNLFMKNPVQDAPRRSAIEELVRKVEGTGLPLESMSLNKQDLDRIKKVLDDSGVDDESINQIMGALSSGPLTMDRVLAALTGVEENADSAPTLSEDSIPLLGRFLQDLGLEAEAVKDALSGLEPGQKFGAQEFKDLLLKFGDKNLNGPVLANVDQNNLQSFLASLGIESGDIEKFMEKMNISGGRISLEGLIGFMKSLESPQNMGRDAMDNVQQILKDMYLDASLAKRPHFNRIMSLLQAMGDKQINGRFMSDNPAVQALRGGSAAAKNITQGTGAFGQSTADSSGQQSEMSGADAKGAKAASQVRSKSASLPRSLSESVARQVADKMIYQSRNNQHRLNLQLEPRDLGKINIRLVMKNQGLHAHITAENSQVKGALEEQAAQLRETLAQHGLELESFDVSLGQDQDRDQQQAHSRKRGIKFSLADEPGKDSEAVGIDDDPLITSGVQQSPGLVDRRV